MEIQMATIRLFHGTAHKFEAFDTHFTMRGSEANSALGIHLTEVPGIAADYAELARKDAGASVPMVLVVEVEAARMVVVDDASEFLGYDQDLFDPETNIPREDYVAARHTLQAEGFDGVTVSGTGMDDLDATWVIFDPAALRIVGSLTIEEAYEEPEAEYEGVDFVGRPLFAASCPDTCPDL